MTKQEFISELSFRLENAGITNYINLVEYYDEMISDRIDAGMSEEEAVNELESIDSIVENAKLELPVSKLIKEKVKDTKTKVKSSNISGLVILLLVLGFPVWFPLLITFFSLALVIAIVFFVVVFVLYVVDFSIVISAVACAGAIVFSAVPIAAKVMLLGAAFLLGGLAIILWKPLCNIAKAVLKGFGHFIKGIKRIFIR